MTWFSLPTVDADKRAAFFNSASAATWLAGQPQANAVAMLASLVEQLEAFNTCRVAPRERFKVLEVLRPALFAVSADSQRRYEQKALPLLAGEQLAFDNTRRLWRAAALGYLHCLRACLDQDQAIAQHGARLTHRALACLRLEQMSCYVAGAEPDGEFWAILHSLWAAAEHLGIERQPVADTQLRETRESTASGHYVMVLLLHLARPFTLSRGQLAAVVRWLSRWREQAKVQRGAETSPKACVLALDLSATTPIHDPLSAAGAARWLLLDGVLRKMRGRLDALANGESPEGLKLGSGLSSAECQALLTSLAHHLAHPLAADAPDGEASTVLAAGVDNAYRLLGGAPLKDEAGMPTSSFASQLAVEQLAVFGHVVREQESSAESVAETWRLASLDAGELRLVRDADSRGARLLLRGLLAIRLPRRADYVLATVEGLRSRPDGSLWVSASVLAGKPMPLLAELREKSTGKLSRYPALLLTPENSQAATLLFLPAGLTGRALLVRLSDSRGASLPDFRLLDCVVRGGDNEGWTVA